MEGYEPTPLHEVPTLAAELGVGRVFIKDESSRFGLPAFKVLGASYAIARALSAYWGSKNLLSVEELIASAGSRPRVTLVCATDGNHGRAVARMASILGLPCHVFVPAALTREAISAIASEGATVHELHAPYDEVVSQMRQTAPQLSENFLVIQDTAWDGYQEIPGWIVDGYSTMLAELDSQMQLASASSPDLVLAPAGVGSLAQAIVSYFRSVEAPPAISIVEPTAAPAVFCALKSGSPSTVETGDTIMRGLNCGTVSELAWPVLRAGADAAVLVDDSDTREAVHTLFTAGIDAGPCGAATLAGARKIIKAAGKQLGINETSTVVLFNTESLEANPI